MEDLLLLIARSLYDYLSQCLNLLFCQTKLIVGLSWIGYFWPVRKKLLVYLRNSNISNSINKGLWHPESFNSGPGMLSLPTFVVQTQLDLSTQVYWVSLFDCDPLYSSISLACHGGYICLTFRKCFQFPVEGPL